MFTNEIIDFLKNRITQLVKIVEQSATTHNSILGRLSEAQELVKLAESGTENIAAAAAQIEAAVAPVVVPEAAPVVEEVASVVEEVAKDVEAVLV